MATPPRASPHTCSPFTRAVVAAMRRLYPESLADASFDNTGLLLEAPFDASRARQNNSVLLTVDLTRAVADEAIERRDSVIVTYHPIIFRALKSLTLADSQQATLLRLAAAGISVYSPHTAVDAAPGGNGDWLADVVVGAYPAAPQPVGDGPAAGGRRKRGAYALHYHDTDAFPRRSGAHILPHTRTIIAPHPSRPDAGSGRLVRFARPQPLSRIISNVAAALNAPKAFALALPYGCGVDDVSVGRVAVCAGAGAGVLEGVEPLPAPAGGAGPGAGAGGAAGGAAVGEGGGGTDLLLTGEMPHHAALAAVERGQAVLCLLHSNSERGYLKQVMREKLTRAVGEEWVRVEREGSAGEGGSTSQSADDDAVRVQRDMMEEEGFSVDVSERDRDPFGHAVFED